MSTSPAITFRVVENFFDRATVQKAVDKAKRRQFSKAGAFVRRSARSSIRPATKKQQRRRRADRFAARARRGRDPTISRPGKPPKQHTKAKQNLRLILFAWDPATESVVVGPVRFKNASGVDVPGVLEQGGRTRIVRRSKSGRRTSRPATIKPRPFMQPALEKEAPKFPNLFKNSVR